MTPTPVTPLSASEESALVLRAKAGSEDALAQLMERFAPALVDGVDRHTIGFANASTIEDLRSEARSALLDSVRDYQPHRGTRFGTLVRLYVRRRVIDYIRKCNRFDSRCSARIETSGAANLPETGYEVDNVRLAELARLSQLLATLPDADREVLEMRYERRMSLPEIRRALPGRYSSVRRLSAHIDSLVQTLRKQI